MRDEEWEKINKLYKKTKEERGIMIGNFQTECFG